MNGPIGIEYDSPRDVLEGRGDAQRRITDEDEPTELPNFDFPSAPEMATMVFDLVAFVGKNKDAWIEVLKTGKKLVISVDVIPEGVRLTKAIVLANAFRRKGYKVSFTGDSHGMPTENPDGDRTNMTVSLPDENVANSYMDSMNNWRG